METISRSDNKYGNGIYKNKISTGYKYQTEYDYLFKIILMGDSGVGKTSLISRYVDDEFFETFISTIGVDFKIRTVTIQDKIVKLQIWDTAGQERFRSIMSSYYRGSHAMMCIYDVSNRKSFENIENIWLVEYKKYFDSTCNCIIIGNKIDIPNRIVSEHEGKELASKNNMLYTEISSKQNINVDSSFNIILSHLISNKDSVSKSIIHSLPQTVSSPNKKCC